MIRLLFASFLCLPMIAVAAPPEEVVKKELESLKGTWTGTAKVVRTSGSFNTKETKTEELVATYTMEINGDQLTMSEKLDGKERRTSLSIKVDPTKKPAAIDLVTKEGTVLGIYERKGDELTLSFDKSDKAERPKGFVKERSLVLRRKK
jgi:uncharacterized protein (TIGR03067 family)